MGGLSLGIKVCFYVKWFPLMLNVTVYEKI